MTLILYNINKLEDIKGLLQKLPKELYTSPKEILSKATIGQHFRHILEFYICLEKGAKTGTVCYDERERNILIETSKAYAMSCIEKLIPFLASLKVDQSLTLKANYSKNPEEHTTLNTSLFRELAYALDHTVHHLAIIKIALSGEDAKVLMDNNFGVAPSTIRYRNQVAT
jgi:hypothetical protein